MDSTLFPDFGTVRIDRFRNHIRRTCEFTQFTVQAQKKNPKTHQWTEPRKRRSIRLVQTKEAMQKVEAIDEFRKTQKEEELFFDCSFRAEVAGH